MSTTTLKVEIGPEAFTVIGTRDDDGSIVVFHVLDQEGFHVDINTCPSAIWRRFVDALRAVLP